MILWTLVGLLLFKISSGRQDIWLNIPCNKDFQPDDCEFNKTGFYTVEELDRCGPARMTLNARNYFLGKAGRGITYKDNKDAFDRIRIQPKMLRDVSQNSIKTTVLKGLKVDLPIGLCPVALHKLVSKDGELDTVRGLYGTRTVMIMSSFASTRTEDVALAAAGGGLHLWQQLYIFRNRSVTVDLVRRAERSGVEALVMTADSPLDAYVSCNARITVQIPDDANKSLNINSWSTEYDPAANFADIAWLKSITKLPIIVKGILTGEDAVRAVKAGASAILVSNHGGRQMDGVPATIDALPSVVRALRGLLPPIREVYLDGGVRSGQDVFKAIARGAKMVFVGRPQIWALAVGGSEGIRKMMTILKEQFNQTMLSAGARDVASIGPEFLVNC